MAAIIFSADGEYVFIALEGSVSGDQIIAKASRDDLSSWSIAYNTGGGSSANVQSCIANPDVMFFHGSLNGAYVLKHTISTGANDDISPPGLTSGDFVQCLSVNPDDENEIVITIDTDQDLKYSSDGGANWSDWDAVLGFDGTALWVLWSGLYALHRYFVAGKVGVGNLDYLYSPNEGASDDNRESAGLAALANIVNVEATE